MSADIDALLSAVTEEAVFEKLLDMTETLGVPARSWRKGSRLRTVLRACARYLADLSVVQRSIVRGLFLDTAEGPPLTALAHYVYGVDRKTATFATGFLEFANAGAGVFAPADYPAGSVRAFNPETGKAYVNAEALSLAAYETKLVAVVAVEEGSASSASPDTITGLETTLLGVTVSNPGAVVGSDAESDEELRAACRAKLASLSMLGPRGAYEYAIRQAKRIDGSAVNVNRHRVSPSSSTGTVTVYLASPSGAPVSDDITAVEEAVEALARPDSVTVTVLAATPVPLTRTIDVWAAKTPGVTAAQIKAAVDAALVSFVAGFKIGGLPKPPLTQGKLYVDKLEAVASSAHPSIYDVDVTPSTDLEMADGDVATLATTTVVHVVDV